MKRIARALLLILAAGLTIWPVISRPLMADGKAFAPPQAAGVQTADQQALLVCDEGRQTLVVETNLRSDTSSLAWLVPVPAVPTIEAATPGLFPTLQHQFAPRRVTTVTRWWMGILFVAVLLGLAITEQRVGPAGCLLIVLAVVLVSISIPKFSATRDHDAVTVHARDHVGAYETVVIEGASADVVLDWLDTRGFAAPAGTAPVIARYIEDGWVFAAVRLRDDATSDAAITPHPLALSFDTDRCVYPMRLTGVDQHQPITVDLFVFADEQAHIRGFRTLAALEAHRSPDREGSSDFVPWLELRHELDVRHPALRDLTGLAPGDQRVATRLRGTLRPEQLHEDLIVGFVPLTPFRENRYSPRAALTWSINVAALLLGLGIVGIAIRQRVSRRVGARVILAVVLVALAGGAASHFALPGDTTAAADTVRVFRGQHRSVFSNLQVLLESTPELYLAGAPDIELVRRTITDGWPTIAHTALPPELDAPGHYLVRQADDGIEVVMFDQAGGEHLAWSWWRAESADTLP